MKLNDVLAYVSLLDKQGYKEIGGNVTTSVPDGVKASDTLNVKILDEAEVLYRTTTSEKDGKDYSWRLVIVKVSSEKGNFFARVKEANLPKPDTQAKVQFTEVKGKLRAELIAS